MAKYSAATTLQQLATLVQGDVNALAEVVLALKQEVFAQKDELKYVDKKGAVQSAPAPLAGDRC